MNHKVGRRYLPVVMMASSLAIASACSSTAGSGSVTTPTTGATSPSATSAAPTTTAAPAAQAVPVAPASAAGALTISTGSADVKVGSTTLHLPSTATDASWSADGSEITYVDADGNIAVANWDGSGARALTKTNKSVLRAQPVFVGAGNEVAFSERDKHGVWHVYGANALTTRPLGADRQPNNEGDIWADPTDHDHAASSAYIAAPGRRAGVNLIAYEHDAAAGAQVWIVDFNQREPDSAFLIAGSHPALSPDGKSVAYVGKNGQLYVTSTTKSSKPTSKQITFGLTGIAHPVWAPTGDRITFATASDVESVAAKLAPGVTTNAPTVESPKPGVPAYVRSAPTTVTRLTGSDSIADSIVASKRMWNLDNAKTNVQSEGSLSMPTVVTLVSTADPTVLDHVSAFAFDGRGPVLFTDGKTLDPTTAAEIKRALAKPAYAGMDLRVQIYGNTSVMSPAIQTAAAALGYPVSRISGAIHQQTYLPIIVASDTDQAVLGNLLYLYQNFKVVLLHGGSMTAAQQALFRYPADSSSPVTVYVAGAAAKAAVAANWPGKPTGVHIVDLPTAVSDESIQFQTYYANSIALVAEGDRTSMVLANQGNNALVIVVGKGGSLSPAAITWLRSNAATIETINVFGDSSNVSAATLAAAVAAVSGPAGAAS
jgi:hypothetical protein